MKIVYDIALLGLRGRSGLARVAENLALGLAVTVQGGDAGQTHLNLRPLSQ